MEYYSNGQNVREWIHMDDHVRGIDAILQKGAPGWVCNFVPDRKGHDLRYAVNYGKARQELGYDSEIHFGEGLKSTIRWYLENEQWWKPLMK